MHDGCITHTNTHTDREQKEKLAKTAVFSTLKTESIFCYATEKNKELQNENGDTAQQK